MATDITIHMPAVITLPRGLPDMITAGGNRAARRFVEFFTATIRSSNTREVYARIIVRFLSWCAGFYPR
jgi:hypothetical protein